MTHIFLIGPTSINPLLDNITHKIQENSNQKSLESFSICLDSKSIWFIRTNLNILKSELFSDEFFEKISDILFYIKNLKYFRLNLRSNFHIIIFFEIKKNRSFDKNTNFKKNHFIHALQSILPKLVLFDMSIFSSWYYYKFLLYFMNFLIDWRRVNDADFNFDDIAMIFKVFHKFIGNEMKSFTLNLSRFYFISSKWFLKNYVSRQLVFDKPLIIVSDLLSSKRNFINVEIQWKGFFKY